MRVNSHIAIVSYAQNLVKHLVWLEVPPVIIDGAAFVPLSFVADFFGYDVSWAPGGGQSFVIITR